MIVRGNFSEKISILIKEQKHSQSRWHRRLERLLLQVHLLVQERKSMGYHPRIECKKIATFQTTRTQRSELWFVNNTKLEEKILGFAAKYAKRYDVKLYALAIEGNHIQFPALFPKGNRAHFMRDFNSMVARTVPRYQRTYPGGKLWARRYSAEYLAGEGAIEKQFFYTVLQPVYDGLVDRIEQYEWYNCFEDAIHGRVKTFKVVRWKEYNDAKRWNDKVLIEEYTDTFELKYERLPGYEELSQEEYITLMREKLKEWTQIAIEVRPAKKAAGREALRRVRPGSIPRHTKVSGMYDFRPRALGEDKKSIDEANEWYFSFHFRYKSASRRYRMGKKNVRFPKGSYKPPTFTVVDSRSTL